MESKTLLNGPARVSGVSLPENLMLATRARAAQEERPFSWVVRRALVAYLADNELATTQDPQPQPAGEGVS